jgi:hypothetical protein
MASTSARTSSAGRSDDFVPLYTGQNVQRFQVQLRMVRTSRLCASLGGRMGPCSNDGVGMRSPPALYAIRSRRSTTPMTSMSTIVPRPMATITAHSEPEMDAVPNATCMNGA